MRILSLEEVPLQLETSDISSFFGGVDWQYPDPMPCYFLPKDSGPQVWLAGLIGDTFLNRGPAMLWITETGIWPSSERMDLFDRYRSSYGEKRSARDAPIHIFELEEDRGPFGSILCLGLLFGWDVEVVSLDRSLGITIGHDGWIEYRFAKGHEGIVQYFEKYFSSMRVTEKGE